MFALQDGGMCSSSSTAHMTFQKYGESGECKSDGRGGKIANHVYALGGIKGKTTLFIFLFIKIYETYQTMKARRPQKQRQFCFKTVRYQETAELS